MTPSALIPAELPVPMASGYSSMILLVVVVLGFMLLVQRPMRKQQAAQRELQNSIAEGSRVMLTSGMFGTVTHLGDKQAIVELAPGLEVTVLRQAISKAVTPADEEFEFSDETSATDAFDGVDAVDDMGASPSVQPFAGSPVVGSSSDAAPYAPLTDGTTADHTAADPTGGHVQGHTGASAIPATDAGVQQPATDHLTTDPAFDTERHAPGGENR